MNGLTKASSVSSGGGTVAGKSFEIRPRSLRLSDGVDRWVRDSNYGRWHTATSSRDDRWRGRGNRWITALFNGTIRPLRGREGSWSPFDGCRAPRAA